VGRLQSRGQSPFVIIRRTGIAYWRDSFPLNAYNNTHLLDMQPAICRFYS
jgi:hypothetical protein